MTGGAGSRHSATATVAAGAALASLGAAHAAWNVRALRRPLPDPPATARRVAVLVPARDEAATVPHLLADLRAQRGVPRLSVTVLDDASTDGTGAVARRAAAGDPRVTVVRSDRGPAPGWLGKPAACARLADLAPPDSDVLVFVDADVRLAPSAVAAAVDLLDRSGLDLVSPWPRLVAGSVAERLVQPLNQWSWLTTLPLALAERSPRPSLAAANGQFLVVRAAAYRRAGGHGAVAGEVLDDVALLRAVKRSGGTGGPADGSAIARCRMYDGAAQVRAGYGKSLWTAFGGTAGAAAVGGALALAYVVPPAAAVLGRGRLRALGALGYAAGVASRVVAARATGGRAWPDALAHPLSVLALTGLTADSVHRRRRGALRWKGRPVGAVRPPRDGSPAPAAPAPSGSSATG